MLKFVPPRLRNGSARATPEPSPLTSRALHARTLHPDELRRLGSEMYGSNASLTSSNYGSMYGSQAHGSMSSLASTPRHRKGRAPVAPKLNSPFRHSAASSPSGSNRTTPMSRKKRPAPAPPKALNGTSDSRLDSSVGASGLDDSLISNSDGLATSTEPAETDSDATPFASIEDTNSMRRRIPIDSSLLEDIPDKSLNSLPAEESITYRRTIVPSTFESPQARGNDRQWEKMKENKESLNKNRQSQILNSPSNAEVDALYGNANKSSYGKWKRRKGPAPALPIPPKKALQMLPLHEIRHELEVIDVQQQGLEKQGIILEKMIRERCEGGENENKPVSEFKPNSKEVEDLILQLFELVNEKNELFRRQAELMYL